MPIQTVPDLREHLELAIRVELSTIPLYLYAMYSIEEQTSEAALLIRSIVTEEMLHAVLVFQSPACDRREPPFRHDGPVPGLSRVVGTSQTGFGVEPRSLLVGTDPRGSDGD